jgi:hypothetical protein
LFGRRPRNIATNGGAALIAGRNGHSRTSARGGCCLCSEQWNVCGQCDIIIDYATASRREEAISTVVTESTVQSLVHRRMNAQQRMRWTPRGAHLMLKVRCAVMNGTLQHDHAAAEGRARRPFRRAA